MNRRRKSIISGYNMKNRDEMYEVYSVILQMKDMKFSVFQMFLKSE